MNRIVREMPLTRLGAGLVLAVFCVAATLSAPVDQPLRALDLGGIALLVVPSLAAGFSRVALPVTALAAVAFYALGYASIFAPAPVTVAVFFAVLAGRPREALVTAVVTALGAFGAGLWHGLAPGQAALGPGWIAGWMVAAAAAGEVLRQRRRLVEHAAREGAQRERLRIARELHDSLTHSISVINVQASVSLHLDDRDPAALAVIRDASADALRELRATVEVLRQEPGLQLLDSLADRCRAGGMELAVHVRSGPLPAEVDGAAYRIVQEALANAARHAPGAAVEVRITRTRDVLLVVVSNGPAATPAVVSGGGAGLIGMRERVDALGGNLRTGPHHGGYRVHAALPLDPA